MERNSKRIIAIAIVAGLAVAGGYGIWYVLQPTAGTYAWSYIDAPGAPNTITADQIIKIGVLGDMGTQTGDGAFHGVQLAAREINSAGGIKIGFNHTYYLGVCKQDTDEGAAVYDTSKATYAAMQMINFWQIDIAIGGFRTEMAVVYAPLIMAYDIPFIGTGSAYDKLTFAALPAPPGGLVAGAKAYEATGSSTYAGYANWIYFFRNMPLSLELMVEEISEYIIELDVANINGTEDLQYFNFIREDLTWNQAAFNAFNTALTAAGLTLGKQLNYSISADSTTIRTSMDLFWDDVNTLPGASVTIPLISAIGSQEMLASYVSKTPNSFICGIDVPSQDKTYFTGGSSGNCKWQINFLSLIEGVNKTDITIPFWNNYVSNYSDSPPYTAVGSYDAVLLLNQAVKTVHSFDGPAVRYYLETRNATNTIKGAGGYIGFDSYHDIVEGFPNGYGLLCQWNATGQQSLLASSQYSAGGFVTNLIQLPNWWTL